MIQYVGIANLSMAGYLPLGAQSAGNSLCRRGPVPLQLPDIDLNSSGCHWVPGLVAVADDEHFQITLELRARCQVCRP